MMVKVSGAGQGNVKSQNFSEKSLTFVDKSLALVERSLSLVYSKHVYYLPLPMSHQLVLKGSSLRLTVVY